MKRTLVHIALCLAVALPALRCAPSPAGPEVTQSGGGTQTFGMAGKLVDTDGNGVAGAEVRAYRALSDTTLDSLVHGETLTDDTGGFLIPYDSSELGLTFTLFGQYNDSELVARIPGVLFDTIGNNTTRRRIDPDTVLVLTFIGVDTLYAPGTVSGVVAVDRDDRSGILAYIPGTSYDARTDSAGRFVISAIPPGTYEVRFRENGYLPARVVDVAVVSNKDTPLDTVTLEIDDAGPPPAPSGLNADYDTVAGVVTLRWDTVTVRDLEGYRVYLDTGTTAPVALSELLTDELFRDTVEFREGDGEAVVTRQYQVRAVDSTNNLSDFSDALEVGCAHPSMVRTSITWSSAPSSSDTVTVGDTVLLAVACHNPTRLNRAVRWYLAADTGLVLLSMRDGLSSRTVEDTLFYRWESATDARFVFAAEDEAGALWRDTIEVTPTLQRVYPNTWDTAGPMPTARRLLCCAVLEGRLYAIGGCRDVELGEPMPYRVAPLDRVEVFDPVGSVWTATGSLITARWDHTAAAANGKLYVLGGLNPTVSVPAVEEYDPAAGVWDSVAAMPRVLSGLASCTYHDSIYLFGGIRRDGWESSIDDSIRVFDPASAAWRSRGRMLLHRYLHRVVVIEGVFYILGGRGGEQGDLYDARPLNRVEWYDPRTGEQGFAANMPFPRTYFGAAAAKGQIVVMGGIDQSSSTTGTILGSVMLFDPAAQQWQAGRDMVEPVWGFGLGVVGGSVYVAGGAIEEPSSGAGPGRTMNVRIYHP